MPENFKNPFEGMHPREIYAGLMAGDFGPTWPEERFQKGYSGTCGVALVRRAFKVIDMLAEDGAFKENWKGLDYGCGWGRFASTLMSKGTPEQLDLCDAFDHTLKLLSRLNYTQHTFKVPELLSPGDIPENTYDFGLAFSIFTHLSPTSFERNIPVLMKSLREGGTMYITVRHEDYFKHRYQEHAEEYTERLAKEGIMFFEGAAGHKYFGRTAVSRDYLRKWANVRYLGLPHPLQHVYALEN